MANKRTLKKEIRSICAALSDELLTAMAYIDGIDTAKADELLLRIAALQINTLSHCSFSFDKSRADFANDHEYNKALRAYNHRAFTKLAADTDAEVAAILKEMNTLLPQSVRDAAVKAMAQK